MIELDCIQGSPEWDAARCGVVTASAIDKIITPAKMKLSAQRDDYLFQLLAERILGHREDSFLGNEWTERGLELEGEALDAFSLVTGLDARRVGFVYADESKRVGCSPDFMIGDEPGELKDPMLKTHLRSLMRGGLREKHKGQTQMALWVTGAQRGWVMSYYPGSPPVIVRTERDEDYQAALDEHIPAFVAELDAEHERYCNL